MRIFGFSIIRIAAMNRVHALSRERMLQVQHLTDDNRSYKRTLEGRDDEIVALKAKCSRVNISRLENYIGRLEDVLKEKGVELPSDGLSEIQREAEAAMLGPLDGITNGNAERD